jgi:hypothetical protein
MDARSYCMWDKYIFAFINLSIIINFRKQGKNRQTLISVQWSVKSFNPRWSWIQDAWKKVFWIPRKRSPLAYINLLSRSFSKLKHFKMPKCIYWRCKLWITYLILSIIEPRETVRTPLNSALSFKQLVCSCPMEDIISN